jgi:hypothetical protein
MRNAYLSTSVHQNSLQLRANSINCVDELLEQGNIDFRQRFEIFGMGVRCIVDMRNKGADRGESLHNSLMGPHEIHPNKLNARVRPEVNQGSARGHNNFRP